MSGRAPRGEGSRLPRLNPWLALLILVLLGFGYVGLWGWLLRG
ncbi:hypothetical protein [Candidatus Palauibacter sp.]